VGEGVGAAVADWALQRAFLPGDNQGESDSGANG
jgi:hypothetical protein